MSKSHYGKSTRKRSAAQGPDDLRGAAGGEPAEAEEGRRPEGGPTRPRADISTVRCPRCGVRQRHPFEKENPGPFRMYCVPSFGGCGHKFGYELASVFDCDSVPWSDDPLPGGRANPSLGDLGPDEEECSPAEVDPYLDYPVNIVDGEEGGVKGSGFEVLRVYYEIRACGCRSRFCEFCSVFLGLKLRDRAISRIRNWPHLQMWTLTVDPKLFDSPRQAFQYVRDRRSISEFVRALKKLGLLESAEYFCAVEWQSKTQMAHYHLLLQAKNIPFAIACAIWNRNRPTGLGPALDGRPGFGSIRFSVPKFDGGGEQAARYITKYLIKPPKEGFPDWVLDMPGQVRRYQTSQKFWGTKPREASPVEPVAAEKPKTMRLHPDTCFCDVCRGDMDSDGETFGECRTIRERNAKCGQKAVLLSVAEVRAPDGKVFKRHEYVASYPSLKECLRLYDGNPDGRRVVELSRVEVEDLRHRMKHGRKAA